MRIPESIKTDSDLYIFYKACIAANLTVTSRFTGVSIVIKKGESLKWKAYSTQGTKSIRNAHLGTFPFTIQGEKDAAKAYKKYLEENKHTRIRQLKGKRKSRVI